MSADQWQMCRLICGMEAVEFEVGVCPECGAGFPSKQCDHKRERTGCTYELRSPKEEFPYIGHTTRRKVREQEHRRRPTAASVSVTRHKDFEFIVTEVFRREMTKGEFRELLEAAEQKAIDATNGKAFNLRRAQWRRPGTATIATEDEKKFWQQEKVKAKKGMQCWYSAQFRLKNPKKVKQHRAKWEQGERARAAYAARQDRYWTKIYEAKGSHHYGTYAGCAAAFSAKYPPT